MPPNSVLEKVARSCDTISHTCFFGNFAVWRCGENDVAGRERGTQAGAVLPVSQHGIDGIKINVLLGHGVDQSYLFLIIGADLGHVLTQERKNVR